jgi:hypothetical protein
MKALTSLEAADWCKSHKIGLDSRGKPVTAGDNLESARFKTPSNASKHLWLCRYMEIALRPWKRCLFWPTECGIWESSENWHLYYRLRQSYDDHRLIEEAPAQLFLDYEKDDLITFLQVGLSMGWDIHLLTQDDYGRIFVSHDEWFAVAVRDKSELEKIAAELLKSGIDILSSPSSAMA